MRHDRSIRILHTGIVASVLFQLVTEKLFDMRSAAGHPQDAMHSLLIGIHEGIGSLALILVCVYLLVVLDDADGRERLFPWLYEEGRASLWREWIRDVPGWFAGRLPPPEESHAIAGAFHGLGIVVALLLGLTGSMLFIGIGPQGKMTPDIRIVAKAHDLLTDLMWIFVAAHAGMALAHEWKGHKMLREMFSLRKDRG